MTRGLKLDDGKLAYHLQDEDADAEMTAVLTFGAVKYEPGNWEFVEEARERYYDAVRRHMRASRRGEILDPETGLLALAGAACSLHFLLALELRAHPELVASLPERLREAVRRGRELRAIRLLGESSTRVSEPESDAPDLGWWWKLVDVPTTKRPRRKPRFGGAPSRDAALRAAEEVQARLRWVRAKIILSEKRAGGFSVEALPPREKKTRRR